MGSCASLTLYRIHRIKTNVYEIRYVKQNSKGDKRDLNHSTQL